MRENIIKSKSFEFAIRIVKLNQYLCNDKKEFELSKQLLRSGTSVVAMVREGKHSESKADFVHKLAIAQKEINEIIYWLKLFRRFGICNPGRLSPGFNKLFVIYNPGRLSPGF